MKENLIGRDEEGTQLSPPGGESTKLSSLDSSILIRKSLGVEDESNEDFEEPVERTVASRSER